MARPSSYTPEEDRIIMVTSGKSPDHTNQLLAAGGHAERSASQIASRRKRLKANGYTPPTLVGVASNPNEVDRYERIRQLQQLVETLEIQLQEARIELRRELRERAAELEAIAQSDRQAAEALTLFDQTEPAESAG